MSETIEHDLSTMEGRVAAACQWFDLTPPALRRGRKPAGSVMFTDEVQAWLTASGLSWNWVLTGDPKEALEMNRQTRLLEKEAVKVSRSLDDEERALLHSVLFLIVDGELCAEDVIGAYKAALAKLHDERARAKG